MAFLDSLNEVVKSNFLIIMGHERGSILKGKMIQRMFENLGKGVSFFFKRWYDTSKQLKLQKTVNVIQKKHYVSILEQATGNKKSDLIKASVSALHKNLRIKKICKSFFNKLLDTQCGMTMKAIQAWHNLPSKDLNKKKQRVIKFQRKLQELAEKGIRYIVNIMKNELLKGESKQKYILNKLVNKCMSYEQRKYIHWKVITKELVLLDKARLLTKTLDHIHCSISKLFKNWVASDTKSELFCKEKAVTILVRNNAMAMQSAFDIWKLWYFSFKTSHKMKILGRLEKICSS